MSPTEDRSDDQLLMENVRKRMLTFGNELQQSFEHVHADVENYKFSVDKRADGVDIEVNFKAFVHPMHKEATKVMQ